MCTVLSIYTLPCLLCAVGHMALALWVWPHGFGPKRRMRPGLCVMAPSWMARLYLYSLCSGKAVLQHEGLGEKEGSMGAPCV